MGNQETSNKIRLICNSYLNIEIQSKCDIAFRVSKKIIIKFNRSVANNICQKIHKSFEYIL